MGTGGLNLRSSAIQKLIEIEPATARPDTLGLRSVMFRVESVDDTVARRRANGAEFVGEVAQHEDKYRPLFSRCPVCGTLGPSAVERAFTSTAARALC
jgi:hypothetical protein